MGDFVENGFTVFGVESEILQGQWTRRARIGSSSRPSDLSLVFTVAHWNSPLPTGIHRCPLAFTVARLCRWISGEKRLKEADQLSLGLQACLSWLAGVTT